MLLVDKVFIKRIHNFSSHSVVIWNWKTIQMFVYIFYQRMVYHFIWGFILFFFVFRINHCEYGYENIGVKNVHPPTSYSYSYSWTPKVSVLCTKDIEHPLPFLCILRIYVKYVSEISFSLENMNITNKSRKIETKHHHHPSSLTSHSNCSPQLSHPSQSWHHNTSAYTQIYISCTIT